MPMIARVVAQCDRCGKEAIGVPEKWKGCDGKVYCSECLEWRVEDAPVGSYLMQGDHMLGYFPADKDAAELAALARRLLELCEDLVEQTVDMQFARQGAPIEMPALDAIRKVLADRTLVERMRQVWGETSPLVGRRKE